MILANEDLLAISNLLDAKLKPTDQLLNSLERQIMILLKRFWESIAKSWKRFFGCNAIQSRIFVEKLFFISTMWHQAEARCLWNTLELPVHLDNWKLSRWMLLPGCPKWFC